LDLVRALFKIGYISNYVIVNTNQDASCTGTPYDSKHS